MEFALLLVIIGILECYCENTDSPGCKAVIKYIKGWETFFGFLIILGIIAGVIYFLVK